MNPHVDLGAAADFIWRNARVLERHVFAALFRRGETMRALEALRPYQNADGGFGTEQSPADLDTIADLQKVPMLLPLWPLLTRRVGPRAKSWSTPIRSSRR